jgi:hypothetical protein
VKKASINFYAGFFHIRNTIMARPKYHNFTLKTPQYDNCKVLSPEGNLMFRCHKKKVYWYLDRDLGELVNDNPLTIRLIFDPKGMGHVNDPYFLQEMENKCVVCGCIEHLTRHHVVPKSYRKHFPLEFKNHRSYDVMSLCVPCHRLYEDLALELRKVLADKYLAPMGGGISFNKELAKVRGSAGALKKYKSQIPQSRIDELYNIIKTHLNKEDVTDEDLDQLLKLEVYSFKGYVHHGKKVMEKVGTEIKAVEEFIRFWRLHFVEKMQPKHLPKYWTVDRPLIGQFGDKDFKDLPSFLQSQLL